MNRRRISLVVLVLVIGALGAVYFWSSRREPAYIPEEDAPPPFRLITLVERPREAVSRIYVRHNGNTRLFLPGEEAWYLADYPGLVLDTARVADLLRVAFQLMVPEKIHEDTAGLNLAEFGLDPPVATITAYTGDGETAPVHLGNATPDLQFHFLMVAGDPAMYLVPRHVAHWMTQTTEALLCRYLPFFHAEEIIRFRLAQRGREPFEVALSEDQERLAAFLDLGVNPLDAVLPVAITGREVDSTNLNHLVLGEFSMAFHLGEVAALFPGDLSPFGLDDPFLSFFLETQTDTTHLHFGNTFTREVNGAPVPHIYVKFAHRPHVFMAELAPVHFLTDLNVVRFITRFVALVPIAELERVVITHPVPERNLEMIINNDPERNAIAPTINNTPIPDRPFRLLYRMLIGIGADSPLEPFPMEGAPELTITYYMLDGTQTVIEFFDFDENFFSFSLDGDYVWAVTSRRNAEMFFNEAARLLHEHGM
ncbi:MAG: DUF4340 domain-containing protein [Defluviitaleaceae bacterium]|nr:DUF4340 domain-containing protein [Defluviitaleaceae bacterium]MCL2238711.1 DUF4340 domain-containing protein [Defluviitaleaceae bacterium]